MEIIQIVKRTGVDGAKYIEENIDPQFHAIKYLHEHVNGDSFIPLVVANAIVSYQLSGKGEDWWWEFAKWFSKHPVDEFSVAYEEFLPRSKTNRRIVRAKIRRLEKINEFLLCLDPQTHYRNMVLLRDRLTERLGSSPTAKTVVFAVKMFGYAMRIATGDFQQYPFEIPIPADSRIERITRQISGEDPICFWNNVAEETSIPPLHIDSILWPALSGDPEIHEKIVRSFGEQGKALIQMVLPHTSPRRQSQSV